MAKEKKTNTKKTNGEKIENKKKNIKKEEKPIKKNTQKNQNSKIEDKNVIKEEKPSKKNMHKKQNKKTEEKNTQIIKSSTDEITKLVEVIIILLVIFAAFYIITYWVKKSKTENNIKNTETTNAIIQYDEILMGRLFAQNNTEYYVLIIDEKDENNYQTYLTSYKEKENALRMYTSKLENAFNKKYKAKDSKLDTENIKELKVKDTTLIRIKEKRIEETFEGKTSVLKKLGDLIK